MKRIEYFLLITVGDVEIEKRGPFPAEENRDAAARDHKRKRGDEDGIHWMDVTIRAYHDECDNVEANIQVEVGDYSGGFFMEGPR